MRFVFIVLLISTPILLFVHTHGFPSQDEGWFIQMGLRLLQGEIPYKDFQTVYNPGSFLLNAFAFILFGDSVLASRLLAFFNSILSILLLLLLSKALKLGKMLQLLLVLFFVSWGPSHLNFTWPVVFCLTTAITSAALIANQKNPTTKFFPLTLGLLAALTFVFKQNFGIAILLAQIIYFLLNKEVRNSRFAFLFSAGYIIHIFLTTAFLLLTNSLIPYISDFIKFTIIKIGMEGIYNSPYPWQYPEPLLYKLSKTLFYLSPLLVSILALFKTLKEKKTHLTFFPLVAITFYLFSIRPTTDFVHLAPLLAISTLSFITLFTSTPNKSLPKIILPFLPALLTLSGFYTGIISNYYRWNAPLASQSEFSIIPKMGIWVDKKTDQISQAVVNYLNSQASKEKYIFVYNYDPIFYLLTRKHNPTPYDYLHSGVIAKEDELKIISSLQGKKVNFVLANIDLKTSQGEFSKFMRSNFTPKKEIGHYTIWVRKTI